MIRRGEGGWVDVGWAFMVARWGDRVPPQVSTGNRTRATIKALPSPLRLPRPYGYIPTQGWRPRGYHDTRPLVTSCPGVAPVCWPSLTTRVPFTHTSRMPVESWCASANVARSAMIPASKSTTSA